MPNIHVISLARSAARRQRFVELNRHLDFQLFDAVDGALLTDTALQQSELFTPDLPYTRGAYGCALSHLALWEEAIRSGRPVTAAEDDAIFRLDFAQQYRAAIDALPPDWDFVLWGWNLDYVLSLSFMPGISPAVAFFDQAQMRKSVQQFRGLDAKPNLIRLDKCWGIPAYTISPQGARKFKERCFPLKDFEMEVPVTKARLRNTGIDSAMNAVYADVNAYACFPPLVVTENDHAISTVQHTPQKNVLSRGFKALKTRVKEALQGGTRTDPSRILR